MFFLFRRSAGCSSFLVTPHPPYSKTYPPLTTDHLPVFRIRGFSLFPSGAVSTYREGRERVSIVDNRCNVTTVVNVQVIKMSAHFAASHQSSSHRLNQPTEMETVFHSPHATILFAGATPNSPKFISLSPKTINSENHEVKTISNHED